MLRCNIYCDSNRTTRQRIKDFTDAAVLTDTVTSFINVLLILQGSVLKIARYSVGHGEEV